MKIIEIPITAAMRKIARAKSKEMGTLQNSILSGKGNVAGFLGELAFNELLLGEIQNTFQHDVIYKTSEGVVRFEVKTKQAKGFPEEYYEASVCDKNTGQRCDAYAFGRVLEKKLDTYWFCGMMNKKEYFEHSTFLRKGEIYGSNKFECKEDCHNIEYGALFMPKKLLANAKRLNFEIITV